MYGLEHLKSVILKNTGIMSLMKMRWNYGGRDKPSEDLKCGFCREMGLEELDKKDFWFSVRPSLCNARELAKDYIADLNEFERKCKEKGILEGNVIWGVSVEDFPDLEPEACGSMDYVGEIGV